MVITGSPMPTPRSPMLAGDHARCWRRSRNGARSPLGATHNHATIDLRTRRHFSEQDPPADILATATALLTILKSPFGEKPPDGHPAGRGSFARTRRLKRAVSVIERAKLIWRNARSAGCGVLLLWWALFFGARTQACEFRVGPKTMHPLTAEASATRQSSALPVRDYTGSTRRPARPLVAVKIEGRRPPGEQAP